MRFIMSLAILVAIQGSVAYGQFDLGRMIQNEVRRGADQIQGEFRGAIQEGIRQGFQPRPERPPVTILPHPTPVRPFPIRQNPGERVVICPPVRILPVEPPVTTLPVQPIVQPGRSGESAVSPPTTEPGPQPTLPVAKSGQRVEIGGAGYGEKPGAVLLTVGEAAMYCEVVQWSDTLVEAVLPELPMVSPVPAQIGVVNAHKEVVDELQVMFAPATKAPPEKSTPAAPEQGSLPLIELARELEIEGDELGDQPGRVHLAMGPLRLQAEVVSWSNTEFTVRMPEMELTGPTAGHLIVLHENGSVLSEMNVVFVNERKTR